MSAAGDDGEPCCISHLFFNSASNNPNPMAVVHAAAAAAPLQGPGDEYFTSAALASAVRSLSRRIRNLLDDSNHGASSPSSDGTPCIVGVYMAPSVEYIVAVLSILRCGEAFLPLDPSWPEERILSVVSSSRASLIVGCRGRTDAVGWLVERAGCKVLYFSMGEDVGEDSGGPEMVWPCESRIPRKFCYLMYTSGSTGKPKGVCGTEKGITKRFWWMQQHFPLSSEDVLLFKTPISFVDHLQEFLGAILTSTTLVVPSSYELKTNPLYIVRILKAYHISRLTAVPSMMRAILPFLDSLDCKQIRQTLNVLVLSGELLSISLWKLLHEILPDTTILNLYGSTEVSGDCTYFNCKSLPKILEAESASSVPIGIPIYNCEISLIGEADTSDEGEICVKGACLMSGYFDELVKDHSSIIHFRTGDFARRLQSGDLIFLGRKDRTIKVNGQRIALEEIENILNEHPDVYDAAVTFCTANGDTSHLEAYFTTKSTGRFENSQIHQHHITEELIMSIRSWLVRKLPSSMVPSRYICVESLPLTASGKIDYAMLASSTSVPIRFRSDYETNQFLDDHLEIVKEAFCSALQVGEISDFDDFFMMGGNSVSAAHTAHKLGIDMRMLYIFPSPVKLLNAISEQKNSHGDFFRHSRKYGKRLKDSRLHGDLQGNLVEKVHNHSVILNAYLSMSQLEKNDGFPVSVGPSKTDSFPPPASNSALSFDGPWISNIGLPKVCSVSRCNQFLHGGGSWLDYVHEAGLPIAIPQYRRCLQHLWKVLLKSCVDASPLVVLKDGNVNLFIGSHSHIFLCIDASRGIVRWEVTLEGRIECSAAVTADFDQVVVGCYKGKIYFLEFNTGAVSWVFQTDGEVKMQPIVDKLRNLIWCGSHDHFLYALDYKRCSCVFKISCGGSVYGSPSIDMARNMIYVASTSGRITGISLEILPFSMVWLYESGAPIFGSLSLNSISGHVISCLVNGRVIVLNPRGDVVWKADIGGPIFAGACISSVLPSQVLICSRNGSVYSFDVNGGTLLWEYEVGDPISASAFVDEQSCLVSGASFCERLACVCSSSGRIHVLRIRSSTDQERVQAPSASESSMVQEFATMDLPGDIFSSPVMIGGHIFVGCRDDYVYCIEFVTQS